MKKRICSLCSFLLISACCDVGKVSDPPGVQKAIAALGDHQVPPSPPPSLSDDPACKLLCWPLTPDRARQILERTEMFATTGVSIGGEPTPQVAAFNTLLQQPDREPRFLRLSRNRNVVARLYALCGLGIGLAPIRWTVSLPSLRPSFVDCRADLANGRVPTTLVIEHLDVVE